MVGEEEEEKKKANSHTSSSFCLGSPQGCNCFPSSHLCLFFFSPLFFLFVLLLAAFFLAIHSGRTHITLAFFSSWSLCLLSLVSLLLRPCVCVYVCVCVRVLYTHVTHPAGGCHVRPKGNGNWKWNMTACVSVHVSNMFLCRTNCTSFPSHISCQGNIFPA